MSAILLHAPRTPTAATASTAAANYPASNALLRPVLRAWRSTTTGASWLQLDLGSSLPVAGVAVNAANFASCTILADNSATPATSRGTLITAIDKQDRRKGSLAFSATVRYIRFNIGAGSPTDGAAYWSIGSAWGFASSLALAVAPLYGGSTVDWVKPQQRAELPNGVMETWATGPVRAELALSFAARETDDLQALVRHTRAGTCWFDFGIASQRDMQFPVAHHEGIATERLEGFNRRLNDVRLREVA